MNEKRIALAEKVAERFNSENRDYRAFVEWDGSISVVFLPVGEISRKDYEEPEDLIEEMDEMDEYGMGVGATFDCE